MGDVQWTRSLPVKSTLDCIDVIIEWKYVKWILQEQSEDKYSLKSYGL